jgi:hypothetical protein
MGCQSIPVIASLAMFLMSLGSGLSSGQISGHAYRADTDKPVAGVVVTLASPGLGATKVKLTKTRTSEDGSYKFDGLHPGNYTVAPTGKASAFSIYGVSRPCHTLMSLNIASGQKLAEINLKLHPVPNVSQMDDGAMTAVYSKERPDLQFALGRFSPDGKLLAFTVGDPDPFQVWLYNLISKRLTPITPKPGPTRGPGILDVEWSGDTLYAETGQARCFAATNAGQIKEMSQLPTEAAAAFQRRRSVFSGRARNQRFIV